MSRKPGTELFFGLVIFGWTLAGLSGCDDPTSAGEVRIDSTVVASSSATPDPARTYEYDFSAVRPDSVLTALWRANLPIDVAWLPVDYRCDDIRGARLTVQLAAPDSRMAHHDFSLGTGRLLCSEELVRYVVSEDGG